MKKNNEELVFSEVKNLLDTNEPEELLRKTGIYYIYGEIEPGGLKSVHQDILLKNISGPKYWDQDITLVINSPGGSLDEADALLDLISTVRMDVETVGLGECCSAASMLLAAGTKGKRKIGPSTKVMTHRFSWGTYDKQHELIARRQIEDATHDQLVEFWMEHSKYNTKKLVEKHLLSKEDKWFTAEQALEAGIVDKIAWRKR